MAGLPKYTEAYIGFVQIKGTTCPAVTDMNKDEWGYVKFLTYDDKGELFGLTKSFYVMSWYEFDKWFGWHPIIQLLDFDSIPGNIIFGTVTRPSPALFRVHAQ